MKRITLKTELEKVNFNEDTMYFEGEGYSGFYYNNSHGNCKHCIISGIQNTLLQNYEDTNKKTLDRLDEILKKVRKLCFTVNVTNTDVLTTLDKRFKRITTTKVPIGYSGGMQYHVVYFTNYDKYTYKTQYLKRVAAGEGSVAKTTKKSFTPEDIIKIMAYKSKYHLNNFLTKLIN
jgi:uncharacterized protein (UPF0210 family)